MRDRLEIYRKRMNDLLDTGDVIYDKMMDDVYDTGETIRSRQRMPYISIATFLIGLISAFIWGWFICSER